MFAAALVVGRKAGDRRPAAIIRAGFLLASLGIAIIIPFVPRADSGWYFVLPLAIVGCGLGLLVSQLNNYTLAPIEEERVSEAAGVNSAAGSLDSPSALPWLGASCSPPCRSASPNWSRTVRSFRKPNKSRSPPPSRTMPRS